MKAVHLNEENQYKNVPAATEYTGSATQLCHILWRREKLCA